MNKPDTWWKVLLRLGLFVAAFTATAVVVFVPLGTVLDDWAAANPGSANLYAHAMAALAMLTATWIVTTFVDRRPFRTVGFERRYAIRDLWLGLAVGMLWLGASIALAFVAGVAEFRNPGDFVGSMLLAAAAVTLLNVLTQQLIVVGYIFQTIRAKAGFIVAMVCSALLFSLLHVAAFQGSLVPPVNVFSAGIVFILAYGVTGNLWFPIGIHFTWNLLLGPVLGLTVSGTGELTLGWQVFELDGPGVLTGGAFGLEGGLIVTLTTTLLILILARLYRRHVTRSGPANSAATID